MVKEDSLREQVENMFNCLLSFCDEHELPDILHGDLVRCRHMMTAIIKLKYEEGEA